MRHLGQCRLAHLDHDRRTSHAHAPGDETPGARLEIETNHVSGARALGDIGIEDWVLDAGGLERKIRVFRLPEENTCREMKCDVDLKVNEVGDNPFWIRVTTEDGFLAWSSPIFVYK